MIVIDKKYFMDKKLLEKLDLMCDRSNGKNKKDNLIIIDGDEGDGKSNMSIACAYYVAQKMERPFDLDRVFFQIDDLIEFAISNKEQVIVWDEAALEGLASDWRSKTQQKLIKLLMVCRKKKHFFFFNIPKFFKLNEYLIVDRSVGLIHVYARQEMQPGRFVYYNKKSKEQLYYTYKSTRKRLYKKHYSFHGSFPEALPKVLNEEEYDKKKDEAIMTLSKKEVVDKKQMKLWKTQYKISQIPNRDAKELAETMGVGLDTIYCWSKIPKEREDVKKELEEEGIFV